MSPAFLTLAGGLPEMSMYCNSASDTAMDAYRPGARGLNCRQCGVDLHGEREVKQGLCTQCADTGARREGESGPAGTRWAHKLWSDVWAMPEDVAREALLAPKHDMPREVAEAIEALIRWRLDNPTDRPRQGRSP